MNHLIDLSGQRFGKLTAECRTRNSGIKTMWQCRCDCGNLKAVWSHCLKSGATTSCGCRRGEANRERATHGMSNTKPFNVWAGIIKRCTQKGSQNYHRYGARGIRVCARWRKFSNFWEDMKSGYSEGLQIERRNVNGNYEPSNCKWATRSEQANNKTNNVFVEVNGTRKTVAQWAREIGVSEQAIHNRIHAGDSPERIIRPISSGHRPLRAA